MVETELEPGLLGRVCKACSGVWVDRAQYDAWRVKQSGDLPETNVDLELAITETGQAKACPQCGHLLLPYRVGHGLAFSIDYCGACGGVWLDRGEWEAVKAKNLHDNLHDMVSQHWQAAVRQADVQQSVERTFARHLGADYAKVHEMRAWLRTHPQKTLILAYLSDAKPE